MTGFLAILNVGSGDTRITFDKDSPAERKRACRIVKDMLRRGYAVLVQAGEKDGKPLYFRATDFDPETAEYIVAGMPEEASEEAPKRPKVTKTRLPAETTKAVGVARSAGGMSDRADSVEMRNMRDHDPFYALRRGIGVLAEMTEEWAGIPMPLDDHPLVVEPRYPRAAALMALGRTAVAGGIEDAKPQKRQLRNRFFSSHKRCDIVIFNEAGKVDWGAHPAIHNLDNQLSTMGASVAWGIEQEAAALRMLAELTSHHSFKMYMLTGAFLETSHRSGVTYMFRRLRPTIALRNDGDEMRILCSLCMHAIGYYQGSFAGAMCPTDDVISHLMLSRGDEPKYWSRCNQHPAFRPEAAI